MALEGVCLAPDDTTLEPNPTWFRLDDGFTRVASYTIDRGRQFELDTTDGGESTVVINDIDGSLDPTNPGGPLYGKIEPLMQAGIARWNPVLEEWQPRFRGFVGEFDYVFDPSQQVNQLTMTLVDIYEVLQQIEMYPGSFGDTPPAGSEGQVFFDNANVDDRLFQIYGNAALPDEFFVIFSGNVLLYETTYSAGESALTAMQEAADAEFPGVSNLYPDRFGRFVFHGRLAKFDPLGTAASTTPDRWDYQEWQAGDSAAVAGDMATIVQLREFAFNRGVSKVLNRALATPIGVADADVAGQIVEDLTSIGLRGQRTWTRQNLLTKEGLLDSSDALTETKRFATYIVDNYSTPHNRVTRLAFRPLPPTDPRAPALWKLLCQADIADSMRITVGSPGGGGFADEHFYIEGVHEQVDGRLRAGVADGDEGYDNVTMSFDLSPAALFDTDPFPTS